MYHQSQLNQSQKSSVGQALIFFTKECNKKYDLHVMRQLLATLLLPQPHLEMFSHK